MAIIKRINPSANPDNALILGENLELCCGQSDTTLACLYKTTFGVASSTVISAIEINGVSSTFANSVNVQNGANTEALIDEIRAVLVASGYDAKDVGTELSGTNLTVQIGFSTARVDSITIGGTARWFQTVKCDSLKSVLDKSIVPGVCLPLVEVNGGSAVAPNGANIYPLTIGTDYDFNFSADSPSHDKLTKITSHEDTDIHSEGTNLSSSISGGIATIDTAGYGNGEVHTFLLRGEGGCRVAVTVLFASA